MFNRARGDDDSSHGTKFRTYVHINPHMTVSPMYVGKVLSIPDRSRSGIRHSIKIIIA